MSAKVVRLKRSYQAVTPDEVSPLTSDVPIPAPKRAGRAALYPFAEMKPGQSFTCPFDKLASVKSGIVRIRKARKGWQFTHQREGADRLRVWRIK